MRHIPNLLSFARLALAPYVFILIWRHDYRGLLWPFVLACMTDALDGYLARRWNVSSRLGAYLDPLADKILLNGTFVVLALTGAVETWLALVVLGRDLLIAAGAGVLYLMTSRKEFPPSLWGKISTAVQALFVIVALGSLAGIPISSAIPALKWATAAAAAVSLADYSRRML